MALFENSRTDPPERWPDRGELEHKPQGHVGFESPKALMDRADEHGEQAGRVRLSEEHAVGEEAPSTIELTGYGKVRKSYCDGQEAQASQDPRARQAMAGEREAGRAKEHTYTQTELERRIEQAGNTDEAVRDQRELMRVAEEELEALPLLDRGLGILSSAWRVELTAGIAALADGVFLAKPLQNAGLASHHDRYLQIAAVAGAIWVAVHAIGLVAGLIGLALKGRERLRAAVIALTGTLGTLLLGFVLLGVLRHEWTGQTNQQIQAFAQGKAASAPGLLDALFITPFTIAAALGAATIIAVFVNGQRGRDKRAKLTKTKAEFEKLEGKDETAKQAVEATRQKLVATDVAINTERADARAAEVEVEIIHETWEAKRHGEDGLVEAAIGRCGTRYRTYDKLYENGACVLAQVPDVERFKRPWRQPARTVQGSGPNGRAPIHPDEFEQLFGDDKKD